MKKFIFSLLLLVGVATAQSATISTNLYAGNNLLILGPGVIQQIILNNATNTSTVTAYLVDSPSTNSTYTNAGYTSAAQTIVTNVTTFTNFFGNIESWTNIMTQATLTTNSASTNYYPILGTFLVTSNSSYSLTYNPNQQFNRGVLITNTGGMQITLIYNK